MAHLVISFTSGVGYSPFFREIADIAKKCFHVASIWQIAGTVTRYVRLVQDSSGGCSGNCYQLTVKQGYTR